MVRILEKTSPRELLNSIAAATGAISTALFFLVGPAVTAFVGVYIELVRRYGNDPPIPFLLLYAALVLSASVGGLWSGLGSAALVVSYISYSTVISFGPDTLTGGSLQAGLGSVLVLVTVLLLGRMRNQNRFFAASLRELVYQRTRDLEATARRLEEEIKERTRAEESLRDSEGHLRSVLDATTDAILTADSSGRFISLNPAAESMFGWSNEELRGQPLEKVVPERYREREREELARFARTGHSSLMGHTVALEGLRRDSTEFPLEFSLAHYRTPHGPVSVASVRDITDRVRSEDELRNNEQNVRNILDSLFTLVGLLTLDGILTEANKTALDVAGLKPEDVLGKPFEEAYWWSYSNSIMQQLRQSMERTARGEAVRYDVVVRVGEDRFITIDFGLQPLFDDTGKVTGMVPSAIDITERVRVEQELREYRDRLEEVVAERTAELAVALEQARESDQLKSQLLSTVSHELRTPLTAIKGFSTMLLDHQDQIGPRESSELLQEIGQACDRLSELIGNLLQLSSLEAGMLPIEPVPTGVQEILEQAITNFRIRAPVSMAEACWATGAE